MLKNIFMKNNMKKVFCILLIISLISYIFLFMFSVESKASSDNFSKYPGYKDLIDKLKKEFPNSEFKILETGLDWNQAIKNETVASHGRNLTYESSGEWICQVCKDKKYDSGLYCASAATVAYYMDPRNILNTDDIFQFELLTYSKGFQNEDGVKKIISGCKYLEGTDSVSKKTYSQIIMEAAEKYNVSPYHIASRIRQEQGTGNGTVTITGNYNGYKGYYNYFNVGATGNGNTQILNNAMATAKNNGWNTKEKAIMGGVEFLQKDYIRWGQNTLYLQKFDVDNSDEDLYWHQYMQNVSAAKAEGQTVRDNYKKSDNNYKNIKFTFSIPVFNNMPTQRSERPGANTNITQNVEIINAGTVGTPIRAGKGNGDTLTKLTNGTKVLRIELAQTQDPDGRFMQYWDKIVLSDGRKGYVPRYYLKQINDITNCNEKYIVSKYTNFRTGPGISCYLIETLSPGQELTVIEKNVYKNVDGESWYRVKLPNGMQGYVGSEYIEKWVDNSEYEKVKVVNNSGVNVREQPGTSSKVLITVYKGSVMTRTEKAVSNVNGYTWDKVTTEDGIIGYVARGDKNEDYIVPVDSDTSSDNKENDEIKLESDQLICIPDVNVSKIKEVYSNTVIKDKSGKVVTTGNVGTGYTATINNKTVTIIKKGDANGDGAIDASDYVRIKNFLRNKEKLDNFQKNGGDVNNDGVIDASDYVRIKNFLRKKETINIK